MDNSDTVKNQLRAQLEASVREAHATLVQTKSAYDLAGEAYQTAQDKLSGFNAIFGEEVYPTEEDFAKSAKKVPPLKEAIVRVMGVDTMNAGMIYDALAAKGWLPKSKDPKSYIGGVLSTFKEIFELADGRRRGFYRVKFKPLSEEIPKVEETPKVEVHSPVLDLQRFTAMDSALQGESITLQSMLQDAGV